MDLAVVRKELADAMVTIRPRLNRYPRVPGAPTVPCAYVVPESCRYDRAMARGLDEIRFTVRVLSSRADDEAGQDLLDSYLAGSGQSSIKAAIEAARGAPGQLALNGACHDLRVEGWSNYTMFEHAGVQYLGAELSVLVIGQGG